MDISEREKWRNYLREMGIVIIRIPMSMDISHSNAYFIDGPSPLLIDTGYPSNEAVKVLEETLNSAGFSITDVQTILLTHSHDDHAGLATHIRDMTGARVLIHHRERGVADDEAFKKYTHRVVDCFREIGTPPAEVENCQKILSEQLSKRIGVSIIPDGLLTGGDEFDTGAGRLRVVETPGHSEGSVSFHIEGAGLLFTGDLISANYNPLSVLMMDYERRGAVSAYDAMMKSINRILEISPRLLLPGHGRPIDTWERLIERITSVQGTLTGSIRELLRAEKELSVYKITRLMYPGAKGPGMIPAVNMVLGILERLNREHIVDRVDNGVVRFISS
ncbi:MAG: MBL fold metallo-hydrolase [Deltaproteobacteria bacterium]|nr:MBL fold metallo-hydrolase [Candidatus Zymogenaceae bacterium]